VELALNDRFVDPTEEGFDISIRISTPRVFTSLSTREICPARRVLCASPGYLASQGMPDTPGALKQHRCLHYGYQESGVQWRLTEKGKEISVPVNCSMWSNNGDVLLQAALEDQGIVLLPTFIAGAELHSGLLHTVLDEFEPAPLTVTALYPRHRHLSAKVQLFIDLLATRLGENPHWDLVR
jgi:DNA-binding transcriptional LysR family regulator